MFEPHVINDEQVGLEVFAHQPARGECVFVHEFADQLKDGDVAHGVAAFDRFVTQGLSQVGFAGARRADHEQVGMLTNERTGGQFEDLPTIDIGVELPVEAVKRLQVDESGRFEGAGGFTVGAQSEFVLYEQFKELFVAELGGLGFLQ
ncbi:MAG: hypothetical protein PWQ89_299, partial [Verrucomicrobiota bacterium]|nr:hypothetical protein [Verrucomicrobiota bacterium]